MEIEKVDKDKEGCGMKKQVRRRVQSSKPYKERLLNMAEARREIATALKFHRASMKQQHPSTTTASASASNSNNNYSGLSCPPPIPHHYPIVPLPPPPPPLHNEHLDLALPDQTLGLNLNFQDFNDLNTSIYHTPMSVATKEPNSSGVGVNGGLQGDVVVLHDAMESEEIRALNLVMSTRTLKTIDIEPEKVTKTAGSDHQDDDDDDDDDGYHPFEQVMEFPPWLINANESSCVQEVYDHHFSEPDPALPWMDIGEIEGMDGEWLA